MSQSKLGSLAKSVVMAQLQLPSVDAVSSIMIARVEMTWDDFLSWFEEWVRRQLLLGHVPRV